MIERGGGTPVKVANEALTAESLAGSIATNCHSTQSGIEKLTQKAEAGDPQAQADLGLLYKSGIEIKKDRVKAIELFQKSAEQGNANGEREFAIMLHWIDKTDAMEWLTKAADQGDSKAKETLLKWQPKENHQTPIAEAAKVANSTTDPTLVADFYLLQQNAEKGDSSAQCNLGMSYKHGIGVKKDMVKAIEWLQKFAEQGNTIGETELACELHGFDGDAAKEWLTKAANEVKAANEGNSHAEDLLKRWYASATPTPPTTNSTNTPEITNSSYLHPKATNGTIGILTVDIKIPTFDETTRQQNGDLELKKGDTVKIISTEPDGVIISKNNSIRIKEPLSVVTQESLNKTTEVTNAPVTTEVTNAPETTTNKFLDEEQSLAEVKNYILDVDKLTIQPYFKPCPNGDVNTLGLHNCNGGKYVEGNRGYWMYAIPDLIPNGESTHPDLKTVSITPDFEKQQPEIATIKSQSDNAAIVSLATALNYLYSKKEGRNVSVSKDFLTWAHDMQPYTDEEIKTKIWADEQAKYPKHENPSGVYNSPDLYTQRTRDANLVQAVKGLQRFGVCDTVPTISNEKSIPPDEQDKEHALERIKAHPLVVRCFKNSKSNKTYIAYLSQPRTSTGTAEDFTREMVIRGKWAAAYYGFISKELKAGHIVIVTGIEITYPKGQDYLKNRTVVRICTKQSVIVTKIMPLIPNFYGIIHPEFLQLHVKSINPDTGMIESDKHVAYDGETKFGDAISIGFD